jgi:glycosyltransferase involved in cell wall biosynthesis
MLKQNYKLSVIIPIYNTEKYLRKCLDSVINQTLKDIEIICINDCSLDKSADVLSEYAQKDQRIKVSSNVKNKGLSFTRNVGLDIAKGEYIAFVDSDDYIKLKAYELMYDKAKGTNADVVCGKVQCVLETQDIANQELTSILKLKQSYFDRSTLKEGLYKVPNDINTMIAVVWNKLYKKTIIDKYHLRFPEGLIREDEAWLWYYMSKIKSVYYIEDVIYEYLIRQNSIINNISKDNSKVVDLIYIQDCIIEHLKTYKLFKKYKKYVVGMFRRNVETLYNEAKNKNLIYKESNKVIKKYGLSIDINYGNVEKIYVKFLGIRVLKIVKSDYKIKVYFLSFILFGTIVYNNK